MTKITIITSMFNADVYIDKFLENIMEISGYETLCEHHIYNIVGSHDDNERVNTKLKDFANIYENFKVINVPSDPGLYELWNMSARRATTEYLMTFNIDDRCSSNYIQDGFNYLMKHDGDLVCSTVKVTKTKNASEDNYETFWYDTKPIYYDDRFPAMTQLKKANVVNMKDHWVELDSNSIYKAKSHQIKSDHKKMVNVYYHRISIEDMFVDTGCNGKYISNNIPHCMPIWRKDLHKYGYFDEKKYSVCADFEFWLRVLKKKPDCKFLLLNRPNILYLEDPGSYGRKGDKQMIDDKLRIMYIRT